MIENTEDFGIYVDELRIKGVPVEDYTEHELTDWYRKWQDVQEMENNYAEIILAQGLTNLDWEPPRTNVLELQIKDDVQNLMKHYRLMKQKIERMEDKLNKLEQIEIRRLIR